ncbi:MAG: BUG/TctC family periplasmic protein, partial [uncultured Craurococcus sp.]
WWSPTPPAAARTSWAACSRSSSPASGRSRSWWRTAPAPPAPSARTRWRRPRPTATRSCSPPRRNSPS